MKEVMEDWRDVDEDKEVMAVRRQGMTKVMWVKMQQASYASSAHTWDRDMYNTRWVHAQNIHSWQVTWLVSEANVYTDLTPPGVFKFRPFWVDSSLHEPRPVAGASSSAREVRSP
jgi:hypothetical protein